MPKRKAAGAAHYHAPDPELPRGEVVYVRKSDAEDYLEDVIRRARIPQVEFDLDDVKDLKVGSCRSAACLDTGSDAPLPPPRFRFRSKPLPAERRAPARADAPMKLLRARALPDKIRFVVHLDTTKLTGDGAPDPRWVASWDWGTDPPQGQTQAAYRAAVIAETKALARLELARRVEAAGAAGTALASEGEEF